MSSGIDNDVTVLIPTSSIPRHPDTSMIDEVIASVRYWFPESWIMLLADGLRPEFADRESQYVEYLNRLQETADDHTIIRLFSRGHLHQTTMIINTLPNVVSPLILFCEHDIGLLTDRPIDWQMMADAIRSNRCDLVRLMLTEDVHPLHEYLYLPPMPDLPHLRPQRQWSGWTHLASTDYYRRLLTGFDTRAKMTVERYVVRLIESQPWDRNRLTSYVPDPQHAKRIYHLDGRLTADGTAKDPSFEEQEIYPPR